MVAENAVMPSAASRSERIIFSFVQLLAGRLLPKNSIRFSPRRAIVLRGNTCRIKFVSHLAAHSSDVGCGSMATETRCPRDVRGRDASYLAPPAQIRTSPIRAYGSHLGCVTARRDILTKFRMRFSACDTVPRYCARPVLC